MTITLVPRELPEFNSLVVSLKRPYRFTGRLIALDPGETTGVTIIDAGPYEFHLVGQLQIGSWPLEKSVPEFVGLFAQLRPTFMVYESYHIYSWRIQEHKFSEVPTLQIIGALKAFSILEKCSYTSQSAQIGKGFFKDSMLKKLNMYYEGAPHARDSLRHALQYLAFGKEPNPQ